MLEFNSSPYRLSIINIAQMCPNLEYLKIGSRKITDASLNQIACSCPKLQHLYLIMCKKITDNGICAIAKSHPNIFTLSFACDTNNRSISDISVKMIADSCPKLQSLDISWRHITDESICIISRSCLKIEKLKPVF